MAEVERDASWAVREGPSPSVHGGAGGGHCARGSQPPARNHQPSACVIQFFLLFSLLLLFAVPLVSIVAPAPSSPSRRKARFFRFVRFLHGPDL